MNTLDQPLGGLACQLPGATSVFFAHRLDFCNGGRQTLREASAREGLDLQTIVEELEALKEQPQTENWVEATDERLIEHIVTRYHQRHREQLAELTNLAARVEQVHGDHPQAPTGLAKHLQLMHDELERHMYKEEHVLFPMILKGMHATVHAPISMMRHEHHDHTRDLERINRMTDNLTLPVDACSTWQALYRGLAILERDLVEHIHLENNLLFERFDRQLGIQGDH